LTSDKLRTTPQFKCHRIHGSTTWDDGFNIGFSTGRWSGNNSTIETKASVFELYKFQVIVQLSMGDWDGDKDGEVDGVVDGEDVEGGTD
jgi:hypothetical protein